MQFVIVVENQLVAQDLTEILQVSFDDAQVAFYPSLDALEQGRRHIAPNVLVASLPTNDPGARPVIQAAAGGAAVVVLDNWDGDSADMPKDWQHVQSPFTQDTIVAAVRSALSITA